MHIYTALRFPDVSAAPAASLPGAQEPLPRSAAVAGGLAGTGGMDRLTVAGGLGGTPATTLTAVASLVATHAGTPE
ncbi:hypothetical protein ACQP25_25785 [Microtetraspora malaysiensis]|uniref:hypothetical protein n=1 Tax=Microtetraspora malaysiensis TaxID=161358 RepID=UPI003D91D8BC